MVAVPQRGILNIMTTGSQEKGETSSQGFRKQEPVHQSSTDDRSDHQSSADDGFVHQSGADDRFDHQSSADDGFVHQSGADDRFDHQSSADDRVDHQSSADDQEVRMMAERSTIMGKLCQQVMALIRWKKGLDMRITEGMVRALEAWLWRRGISIYTKLV
jgi:hypothetical protein